MINRTGTDSSWNEDQCPSDSGPDPAAAAHEETRTLTKTQFRIGLAGSMALAALAWVATAIAEPNLPAPLREYVEQRRNADPTTMEWVVLSFIGPTVEPGIATALNYASSMLFGAVLAMAYCSPAALWFDASRPSAGAVEQ
jgi:hypothetical protein